MKSPFLHRLLVMAVGLFCASSAWAIDPLPPELENAPLEMRAKYWDKMGRDAEEKKTKVAQQRYDKREALQRSVARQIAASSAERLASIEAERAPASSAGPSKKPRSGGLMAALVFFVAVGCGARKFAPQFADSVAAFRRRNAPSSRAGVRSRATPPGRAAPSPATPASPAADTIQCWPARAMQPAEEALANVSHLEDPTAETGVEPEDPAELASEFFSAAPSLYKVLENLLLKVIENNDQDMRLFLLGNFYVYIDSLADKAERAGLRPAFKVSSTIGLLVKRIIEDPTKLTRSTLGTIANALDVTRRLTAPGVPPGLADDPPVRMLVVDDDLLARGAMSCALQTVFDKPDSADGGETALALATAHPYDVIFLDVNMPGMDGFTLCARIHETEVNRLTPVVFVTSRTDAETHDQAICCGGCDLLSKPFVLLELTLKALTFALEDRLQRQKAASN